MWPGAPTYGQSQAPQQMGYGQSHAPQQMGYGQLQAPQWMGYGQMQPQPQRMAFGQMQPQQQMSYGQSNYCAYSYSITQIGDRLHHFTLVLSSSFCACCMGQTIRPGGRGGAPAAPHPAPSGRAYSASRRGSALGRPASNGPATLPRREKVGEQLARQVGQTQRAS